MAISKIDRAKQFLPFDALKGLREELAKKERKAENIEKMELSEEILNNISDSLKELNINDYIKIIYYENGKYKTLKGKVKKLDKQNKKIVFYDDLKINFTDLYNIEKIIE